MVAGDCGSDLGKDPLVNVCSIGRARCALGGDRSGRHVDSWVGFFWQGERVSYPKGLWRRCGGGMRCCPKIAKIVFGGVEGLCEVRVRKGAACEAVITRLKLKSSRLGGL